MLGVYLYGRVQATRPVWKVRGRLQGLRQLVRGVCGGTRPGIEEEEEINVELSREEESLPCQNWTIDVASAVRYCTMKEGMYGGGIAENTRR